MFYGRHVLQLCHRRKGGGVCLIMGYSVYKKFSTSLGSTKSLASLASKSSAVNKHKEPNNVFNYVIDICSKLSLVSCCLLSCLAVVEFPTDLPVPC